MDTLSNPIPKYGFNQSRRIFIFGDDTFRKHLGNSLSVLQFLIPLSFEEYKNDLVQQHFVVVHCDFESTFDIQNVVLFFERIKSPLAYTIIYSSNDKPVTQSHLLLGIELGAKYIVSGARKEETLRNHIKGVVTDNGDEKIFSTLEEEIERCFFERDNKGFAEVHEQLRQLDKYNEKTLRLMVLFNKRVNRQKKVEFYLKKILQINPQSLWAANMLGKLYLRRGEASKGIELLEKISHFQDLNGERLKTLGNAYLNSGNCQQALKVFKKVENLNPNDSELKEGVLKAEIINDNSKNRVLEALDDRKLSKDLISFLNTRAIMEIKIGNYDKGFELYKTALKGVEDNICAAKISFNMGLGYIRLNEIAKAREYFDQSIQFGGDAFKRAEKPLIIAKKILKREIATQRDFIQEKSDSNQSKSNVINFENLEYKL